MIYTSLYVRYEYIDYVKSEDVDYLRLILKQQF
jgi:hypothetical protein